MRTAAQAATDVHGILTSMGTRFAALCLALSSFEPLLLHE